MTDEETETPSDADKEATKRGLAEAEALRRMHEVLAPFPGEKRIRILRASAILLGLKDPVKP